MALSSIIKELCPKCGKVALEEKRTTIFSSVVVHLKCGHILPAASLKSPDAVYEEIVSQSGFKLRPYQIDGIKFGEQANCRFILADEQGLGKMVQSLCLLKLHPEELLPAIVTCPTTIKRQWMFQTIDWCGRNTTFTTQVIQNGKEIAMPGFGLYIITYDILKKPEVFDMVPEIKTIFIDECQRIKNHLSGRAKAVQAIIQSKKIEHIIPMSGTPIKNNAAEYFTVLNMVRPTLFPHYDAFVKYDCDSVETAYGYKVGGLRNPKSFAEKTKDFIIRRTKEEVLPDLPAKDRKFYHADLDPKLNRPYAEALRELDELMYGDGETMGAFELQSCILAIYAKMRKITGIGKVETCVDFVAEHLMSNSRKLVIFLHHHSTAALLQAKLTQLCADGGFNAPLMLTSELDGDARARLVERFKDDDDCRLMIASTQAAGEGLNLQFCSDAVMLERQWNPANEEQAEDRFHRFGQENKVSITYMIASGTIDEYFTELVEQKRALVAAAMDGKEVVWNQADLVKELAMTLISKGRERWRI